MRKTNVTLALMTEGWQTYQSELSKALALVSFGFSWITKAEVLFHDDDKKEPASQKVMQIVE